MSDEHQEKKIIIDEDWKSQVETEKEQLKQNKESGDASSPGGEAGQEYPPASFSVLVSSLAAQAMAALGQFTEPKDGKVYVDLGLAKHQIDTLAMLEQKTKGNLTDEEAKMLNEVVHQLRMGFIAVQGSAVPVSEGDKGKIEMPS